MFVLNTSKSSFWALLLAGSTISSLAQLTDVESDLLEDIGVWVRAQDVVVSEFLGSDKDLSPEQNLPSHNINDFYNLALGQGNSLGAISDTLLDFKIDYLNRNRANSQSLTNILDVLNSSNTHQLNIYNKLQDIYGFLNSYQGYYDLFEVLGTLYFESEYYDNQQIISLLEQLNNNTNQHSFADMGIVTNIYYNTQSLSNNVDYIANYIATNKVDVENPISQSESEAQSKFSFDTAQSFYTNQITKTIDLNPEEAPSFEQYTNTTEIVSSIKNNYQYQQYQSATNQLITALTSFKDGVTDYLDNFKKHDLFTTQYNTRVELIKKGSIKRLPDFEFKFDFAEMNLPSYITTFLTRLYDFLYVILCSWALLDIFGWGLEKFGD